MLQTTASRAVLLAAILAAPLTALAQTTPAGAGGADTLVEEVVVTASRTGLEAREVGSAFTVVTAEEIEDQQITFVKDLLFQLPGVQVTSDRPGASTSVIIRGSNSDEVLYLIDGVELGDPSSTSTSFQTDHLVAFDIERLEVLRGDQSSLYGSDAIGGVVNIITQRATDEGVLFNAQAEAGSYGTLNGGASVIGKSGALDYRATVTGYRQDGPSIASAEFGPATEDDAYERWGVSGRVGYRFTETLEGQVLGLFTDTFNNLDDTGADSFDTVEKDEYTVSAQLRHATVDGRWRTELTGGRYRAERVFFGTFNRPEGDTYEGTKDTYNLITAFAPSRTYRFAAGVNYEEEETDQVTNFSADFNASIETSAAFGEFAFLPTPDLSFTLAGRLDDNSRFGRYDTYRVTGAWVLPTRVGGGEVKLRSSYGTGVKAPGLYQLFDPSYGNPDLEVEESEGADIGADVTWSRAQLTSSLFHTEKTNEIGFVFPAGYVQFGATTTQGVEVGLEAVVTDWFSVAQSYTYLDAQNDETDTWLGRSRHSGFTALTFRPRENWSVTVRSRYQSRVSPPASFGGDAGDYAVVDALGAYQLNDRIELYGRVVNVLDENYAVNFGEQTLGRSGYVGVRARF